VDGEPLLAAEALAATVPGPSGPVAALGPVSLRIAAGERVALVGESGSGKTLLALGMGWLEPPGVRLEGSVRLGGVELATLPERRRARLRGRRIGFVLQEAAASINPVYTVGFQLRELLRLHLGLSRRSARERAAELLAAVGLEPPGEFLAAYAHQLSGGQAQRAALALALAGDPDLLVADEPTTALDPPVAAAVLGLLERHAARPGRALVVASHDLAAVARVATRVVAIHAGEVVEDGPADAVLSHPLHPYTRHLLGLTEAADERPPAPGSWPRGCRFLPRCPLARPACGEPPPLSRRGERTVRCPFAEEGA